VHGLKYAACAHIHEIRDGREKFTALLISYHNQYPNTVAVKNLPNEAKFLLFGV